MRPNFHVNIPEQFTVRQYMRPSFENMDLQEDVDEVDYLKNEVSCSKTMRIPYFRQTFADFSRKDGIMTGF